jgi:hypothetical protein
LVNGIKENLRDIDKDGVSHPLLDNVYEALALIEDEIYEDDMVGSSLDYEDEEE